MKKFVLVTALFAAIAGPALAQKSGHEDHSAKHGGVFVEGKEADYELVAKPDLIRLYVNDHGKPMDVSKGSAKVTLLSGSDKQEVELKPAGAALEAKGAFKVGPGTKAVAVVTNAGKTLGTARFTLK
ncbi:hypothetical protein LRS03_04525 [Rhizobacter sp. J219]|jgi:hypothetical protein|uniref:hypothetical protein n=1 Tax=Rhizobacter sp. J219 TaxID=2898430 RepID=UPI002151A38E|nr:hypothetical protein [Rhizobacter sp. J219]MCR5882164.1 hypothetical protein [Rhizobacter sp. J219]